MIKLDNKTKARIFKLTKIFSITILVLGIVLCVLGVLFMISTIFEEPTIEEGDCFDRFGNKINGVTCEILRYPRGDLGQGLTVIGFFTFLIGVAWLWGQMVSKAFGRLE